MFGLQDVPMRLKYVFMDNAKVVDCGPAQFDEPWYDRWFNSMMDSDDMVFFLVTETTDVFEKEWDFNEYTFGFDPVKNAPVTHSCSCHARGDGPCDLCVTMDCTFFNKE